MRRLSLIATALALMIFPIVPAAQAPVLELRQLDRGSVLQNRSQVSFLVMVVARDHSGSFRASQIVDVPPNAAVGISLSGDVVAIEDARPLFWEAVAKSKVSCGSVTFAAPERLAGAAAEVQRLQSSVRSQAMEESVAAQQLSYLEFETFADRLNFERSNPIARELQARQVASDPIRASEAAAQSTADALVTVGMAAFTSFDVMKADLERHRKEASALQAVAQRAMQERASLREEGTRYQDQMASARGFLDLVAARRGSVDVSGLRAEGVSRACNGTPPAVSEFVDVQLSGLTTTSSVVAEVRFDKGAGHKTVLTRLDGSDQWRGKVVWPFEATQASFAILGQKRVNVPGRLPVGRDSLQVVWKNADARLKAIEKAYKDAKAKSEAGNQKATMIIR